MPINPLIALQAQPAAATSALLQGISGASGIQKLQQAQELAPFEKKIAELKAGLAEEQMTPEAIEGRKLQTVVDNMSLEQKQKALRLIPAAKDFKVLLDAGDTEGAILKAQQRMADLQSKGIETSDTAPFLRALETGKIDQAKSMVDSILKLEGIVKPEGTGGLASAKTEILSTGATIQALPSGEVEVRDPSGNIVTGQQRLDTLNQAKEEGISLKQREAAIAIEQARETAGAKARETRISDIKKEFSTNVRESARNDIRINKALALAEETTGGITDSAKVQFAKIFPGIDASNEGALMGSFRELALDQLQKFKGPTTDFEFGIAESVSGVLGDPKTANIARLKGLKRNNWFIRKEKEQFDNFTDAGGDPEDFVFNFNEEVNTKKGNFTLEQIQNTAVKNNLTIEEVLNRLDQ